MELKELIKFINGQKFLLGVVGITFFTVAFLFSQQLPTVFVAKSSVYVHKNTSPVSPEFFTFEGFYANQASKEFTDTVGGIIESEEMVQKALQSMGREGTISEVEDVLKGLEVQKTAPNLLEVSLQRERAEEAREINRALMTTSQEELLILTSSEGEKPFLMKTLSSEPLIEPVRPWPLLNGLVVGLGGLLLTLFILSLREYLKS